MIEIIRQGIGFIGLSFIVAAAFMHGTISGLITTGLLCVVIYVVGTIFSGTEVKSDAQSSAESAENQ